MSLTAPRAAGSTVSPELTPLSDHEWRVIDSSRDPDDAASVLGFVDRMLDGQYEVIVVRPGSGRGPGSGVSRTLVTDLNEVTALFAAE